MYNNEYFKKQKLESMKNNNVKEWSSFDEAIKKYAFKYNLDFLTPLQQLDALYEGNVESWDGYEKSIGEYEQYVDYVTEELGLTGVEKYVRQHNVEVESNNENIDKMIDELLINEVKSELKLHHIMKSTRLSPIALEIKKLFPHETDFQIAEKVNDFDKNANFYTPKTELGFEMLYKTKEFASQVYSGENITANEYLLVAQPLFLALSIKSGHLEREVKEYFNK